MRIKDWHETFEGPESRRPKGRMEWFSFPVDIRSKGCVQLMSRQDKGCHAMTVFVMLCQLSADQLPDKRGTLLHSDGSEFSVEHLSVLMNGLRPKIIQESLEILEEIGWIDRSMTDHVRSCHAMTESGTNKTGQDKTETGQRQDKTRQDKTPTVADLNDLLQNFDTFWLVFPKGRKEGKKKALESFRKAVASGVPAERIIESAREYAESEVGKAGKAGFVKGPVPWLNQGCWDDDRESWKLQPEKRPVTFTEQRAINNANAVSFYENYLEDQEKQNENGQKRICSSNEQAVRGLPDGHESADV